MTELERLLAIEEIKQLKARYYDPGLLAKYLGFNKEPLRAVEAFRDVKLFPAVEAVPPAAGSTKLTLNKVNHPPADSAWRVVSFSHFVTTKRFV